MHRRHALQLLGGTLAGAALGGLAGPARACELFPQTPGWRFHVLRHGDVIGEHVFTFSRREGDFVVDVAIDIAVKMLGLTLFRFTHRAEEVWRDGRLQSLASTTDDDGTSWRLECERRDGALRGQVNDVAINVPGVVVPASLWHHDTPKAEILFDTIDGRTKAVNSAPLGEEPLTVGDRQVVARHWRLTGEMERDVWYGPDCAIARVAFPARDGSIITLQRQ